MTYAARVAEIRALRATWRRAAETYWREQHGHLDNHTAYTRALERSERDARRYKETKK